MPVFGASPDSVTEDTWDRPVERKPRPGVMALVNYFIYHPHMRMSHRATQEDRTILGAHFSRKLSAGYTDDVLRDMVDRFYQSWGAEHDKPALAFVSTKMQDQLTEGVRVISTDPVMNWLLDGMPDDGPVSDSKGMRRAVLLHAGDLAHRYPDLVRQLVSSDLDPEDVGDGLEALDLLVKWNLGENVVRPTDAACVYWQRYVTIPPALLGNRRSPKSVARPRGTMQQAISTTRSKKVDWFTQ